MTDVFSNLLTKLRIFFMRQGLIIFLFALMSNFTLFAQSKFDTHMEFSIDTFPMFDMSELFEGFGNLDSTFLDFFSNFDFQIQDFDFDVLDTIDFQGRNLDMSDLFKGYGQMDSSFFDFFSDFDIRIQDYSWPDFQAMDSTDLEGQELDISTYIEQFLNQNKDFASIGEPASGLTIGHHSNNVSHSTASWIVEEVSKEIGHNQFTKITLSIEGIYVDNKPTDISAIKYLKAVEEMEGKTLNAYESVVIRMGAKI